MGRAPHADGSEFDRFLSCGVATHRPPRSHGWLRDPSRDRLIPTPTGIHPGAHQGVAVVAKCASVVGRRTPLASPDGQRITIEFIHIIERHAIQKAVEARLYVLAWRCSK